MTDKTIDLDEHRGMAAQKATDQRRMLAEILIKEGAKIKPKDRTGKTPLDYAESGSMIKLLKQNGATER
jgi:hypothetical protein